MTLNTKLAGMVYLHLPGVSASSKRMRIARENNLCVSAPSRILVDRSFHVLWEREIGTT